MEKYTEIREIFEKHSYVRRFSKGDIIYYQGDLPTSFYYLKKGSVRVYMTSSDGVEHTLSTARRGEILGEAAFFDKMPRVSSASALDEIEVAVIDEQRLLALISEHPRLALELLEIQAVRIRQLSGQIDAMTFLSADARIARLLLKNADSGGKVTLTHEEIASEVGVSRVTVSKLLSRFVRDGLIRTSYRRIEVLNRERLREFSGMSTTHPLK